MRKPQPSTGVKIGKDEADRIRQWLRNRAMTQVDMAKKLGVSVGVLRNVFAGSASLNKDAHVKLVALMKP
jgi:ribosome-binding protein aMBF1 (putative translation factor)